LEETLTTHHPFSLTWRQAGRAKRWSAFPAVNSIPFWSLQCGSAIALFWLMRHLLKFAMAFTNDLLVKLPYLEPLQTFYRDPTQSLLLTLLLLLCLSPWLLDALLRLFYGLQPLPIETLSTQSPEASRLLQRYCRQRRWRLPQLGILPASAPLVLTYGNLPRTARIVVSQGLLAQLADDEIATIYAAQLGHLAHRDFVLMSLFMLVNQLPYVVYRQVSIWGDKRANKILRAMAALWANFAYGLWFLLSVPAFWLSQLRIYYSDRFAAEITGNPNGLSRALLKITQGVAQDIQQQGHTSWLLESWNLLTIVSYNQAIAHSNLHSLAEFEAALAWDCVNPVRYWLCINNTHPLLGDRLQRLNRIAQYWHLETELDLPASRQGSRGAEGQRSRGAEEQRGRGESYLPSTVYHLPKPRHSPFTTRHSFLLQAAPYLGIFLGLAFGGLTWLVGLIGNLLGIVQLAWMYGDWWLIQGCIPIGLSIGTFIRINAFFPGIKPASLLADPNLPDLLTDPTILPINSQPLCLQGKLLGRRGISNWLGQDLILHLPTGLVKLHHVSGLGPAGDFLLRSSLHPTDLLGRHLITTGWFRRGATTWIDIDTLRTQDGKISRSHHPVWSTLLAIAATIGGTYTILVGGT